MQTPYEPVTPEDLLDAWPVLAMEERIEGFQLLDPRKSASFFLELAAHDQTGILKGLPHSQRRPWLRLLALDDAVDVIQGFPPEERDALLEHFDEAARRDIIALMAYAEDDAGGLMNPQFALARQDMTADEAIAYVRKQAREKLETIYYVYVIDSEKRLQGVVSLRELFIASSERRVRDFMRTELITAPAEMDQEALSRLFAQHDLIALPIVDTQGRMRGIVTIDDIVDVVQEEATEDIQKLGGMQALDMPYLESSLKEMVRKRGVWLAVLFVGELLTASAMAHFEDELARAVILASFVPLIISSGGNSGSQASTLVIRAMSLEEVRLKDWLHVLGRELQVGLALGSVLGLLGLARVILWQGIFHSYGTHAAMLGLTVGISVLGVVLFGTLSGAMLPFLLRRLNLDPASASAPFVATLVDVTGLVIYFTAARALLTGLLL